MLRNAVEELFAEFATAFARGERPRARDFLDRAGAEADALASMIERFLQSAPRPAATPEDAALVAGWLEGEPPLVTQRVRLGLKRDAVVDALLGALGLAPGKRERLADAYHELETGQLDPDGVDASVWGALAQILKANVRELASWRPPSLELEVSYRAADAQVPLETRAAIRQHPLSEPDEVDRLFRGVS